MVETKPMTTADLDAKAKADKAAAEKLAAEKAAAPAPVHPATVPAKPAVKVAEPLVGEVLPPATAVPPSPSQAEADAIRMGKRDATAEAPATGYKTR